MKLKLGTWSLTPYLIAIALVGLQACGGGGGGEVPPPPADANPVGYYAGTASTTSPVNTDIAIKAISTSTELMFAHIDNATPDTIFYKATFTDITPTTFTADVRIYRNGVFLRTATITNGSITEKSSMSGTLSGTGDYTSTSFSLTYDTTINNRAAPTPENNGWSDASTGGVVGFSLINQGTDIQPVFSSHASITAELDGCGPDDSTLANITGEAATGRIRKYDVTHTTCTSGTDISLTGYITTFDSGGGTDDRYLWFTFNDTRFFAGVLN